MRRLEQANLRHILGPISHLATMPNGQKYEDWLRSPEGQDWLRKYKKDFGAAKKREGVYEDWKKTTEGKM